MLYPDKVDWVLPSEVEPGETLIAHQYWEPNSPEAKAAFIFPPSPPKDLIYGDWHIAPYYPGFEDDVSRMDRMITVSVNLFQDTDGFLIITDREGKEWAVPNMLMNILAKLEAKV